MFKYEGFVTNHFLFAHYGGGMIIPRSLKTTGNENCFKPAKRPIFWLKIIYDPFTLAKNSFSKIRSINCDRDDFMCWSWAKMSQFILLSLRISGIEFSLVSDKAESSRKVEKAYVLHNHKCPIAQGSRTNHRGQKIEDRVLGTVFKRGDKLLQMLHSFSSILSFLLKHTLWRWVGACKSSSDIAVPVPISDV